ncbi:hypothetical protein KQI42_00030 [Tissierella sp. MSJ-40]|uniref:Uncharacterized protein n=1 Tax=Tissierella simiarum TaxID=2841534 RepID=A0ABS6E1S0_9FIRM|nr:hypothetical protein [Tissierella simiarum]MBU5436375.1 hypothetical protein [Tissierella simiarum]
MAEYTKNYNLKKPSQDDFYNIDDANLNMDKIDTKLKEVEDKIENSSPIIVSESPPIPKDRKKGAFYFIVTDENEIPISPDENIRVSPNMGIKIKEG